MLSGLSENPDFFRDRVNLFLMVGAATRLDRCAHKYLSYLCRSNEINPSLV